MQGFGDSLPGRSKTDNDQLTSGAILPIGYFNQATEQVNDD
jgi:hypothetical protein